MTVELFVTRGLGDNSYMISSGKEALLVDPQRDIWRFQKQIEEQDLKLRYILETHVHNDYVSGALALKDATKGLELALPAKGDYEFEHKKMSEGDTISIGSLNFEVMETPGHTYDHISWIGKEGDTPFGAFTGGSLMIGSAGRTDLLGHDHTHDLTVKQYHSIQRIAELPDEVMIYPTHGSGSFCSSSNPSSERIGSLGNERSYNQALTASSIDEFLDRQLSGLRQYPSYYPQMAPINRRGPEIFHELPEVPALDPDTFKEKMNGAFVLDVRMGREFAARHIPGSYNFELKPSASNYIGWIIPFNAPILIVPDAGGYEDVIELQTQLFRIGYIQVIGYLEGGIDAWSDESGTSSYTYVDASTLKLESSPQILDIRDPQEITDLPVTASEEIFLPALVEQSPQTQGPYYVMCVSGQRAATAASILQMKGIEPILLTNGGVIEVLKNLQQN